jgi:NAD(P)-dependent dehydrogenase (short-subunit alcohol dehydrogenase family)
VESIVGDEGLNVLINNAAIHMNVTSVNDITAENLISQYLTNTVGPIMLTKVKLM